MMAPTSSLARGLWVLLAVLVAIGVYSGANRATVVVSSLGAPPANELAAPDRRSLLVLGSLIGLEPMSERFGVIEADFLSSTRKYNSQPHATLWHVIPGAIFLALAPLQLVSTIRSRHPALHRWLGRVLVVTALPLAGAAFYLAVFSPASGVVGGTASVVFGSLFVVSGVKAFAAARRGDFVHHREWMLRFLAIAYGIAVIRVLDVFLLATVAARPQQLGGPSFWAGWLVTLGFAEWWIRRTRPSSLGRSLAT